MAGPSDLAIQYRAVVKAEYDELGHLWWESWRSTGLAIAQATVETVLRRRIDEEMDGEWDVTVAVAGKRLAGFLALKTRLAVLDQLFVGPDFQRKGIGRELVLLAKRRMPGGFSLRTATENHAACRFYENAGLARTGTATHPSLGHVVAIYRWN